MPASGILTFLFEYMNQKHPNFVSLLQGSYTSDYGYFSVFSVPLVFVTVLANVLPAPVLFAQDV